MNVLSMAAAKHAQWPFAMLNAMHTVMTAFLLVMGSMGLSKNPISSSFLLLFRIR